MNELESLKEYLLSDSSETAKRPLVYPYFKKLFGKDFKVEADAENSDGYVEGKLLVELKTKSEDWLKGLYQGLHYQKLGLSFPYIVVIAKEFIGLWSLKNLPLKAFEIADNSDSQISPQKIGIINANKTSKALKTDILNAYTFRLEKGDFEGIFVKEIEVEIKSLTYALKNLDKARIQINLRNFIDHINVLQGFFDRPLDSIHCFYGMVGYWSGACTVNRIGERSEVIIVDPTRNLSSEPIVIKERHIEAFTRFVESHYIFTNEGSGITYDNYFSRFDEVISRLDPDYAKQHGIYFTDHNLSKFAMWFVHEKFEKNLSDKFIVFDPAGGSGNLITSLDWRGHMKHKIVSELQPDLLKVIERRMRIHEKHIGKYTIIPKTVDNKGLNFLNISGKEYLAEINRVLDEKGLKIDKPLAFLLNPPYKNTDENVAAREQVEAEYVIDPSILSLTGNDAGKERYLAFLGQIINIASEQYQKIGLSAILMIFTPTSWLIPRPTYEHFRIEFDKHFIFKAGFLITSNEFFDVPGKWPLSFTIWTYNRNEKGNLNKVKLFDYTHFKHDDLEQINWSGRIAEINLNIKNIIKGTKQVNFEGKKNSIRKWTKQKMYDFKRNPTKTERESDKVYGGLPLTDSRRQNLKTYGVPNSDFIGFMDDGTPVRINTRKKDKRFLTLCAEDRVWFRLDNDIKSINKTRLLNGPPDKYGYCAYDLESAQKTFTWFALAKSISGRYLVWANQMDIWKPNIKKDKEKYFYSLCFAFGLAENRCIITKFEKNNPIIGASEILIENPLSTNNPEGFWNLILDNHISKNSKKAFNLVQEIKELYSYWEKEYCKNKILSDVGLKDEPYFRYFNYPDFLTPNSGLIQIRRYADINNKSDLQQRFEIINEKTKIVREEIFRLLVEEFKYFQ
ncbi:MAG: hypothetical protein MUC93_06355 [Bacteroidales bacterium]|jgi:hypothetical protein|nr:hypothetical protein [Bacteroidales bacterium]